MGFRDTLITRIVNTDYLSVDGLETLSLYRPATAATYTGVKATSGDIKDKETGGVLSLQKADKVWHLYAATMSVEPLPADELTDENGTVWIIGPKLYDAASIGGLTVYYEVACTRKVT